MSSSPIVLPSNFKLSNVSFKDPRKNASGGQSVLLNYQNDNGKNGPLIMQTPKLRLPFGPDISEPEGGGAKRLSINGSLAHSDSTNLSLKMFSEIIKQLDMFTKKIAVENSEVWFGKKQKLEVLEEFYKSAEKKSKNDKYPSTLKMKLPYKTVSDKIVPQFDIYNESKEPVEVVIDNDIDLSCLEKGSEVVAILQCTGVWFVGKTQFGLGWKVVQLKTYRNQKLIGYSIVDDDPEEVLEEEVLEEEVEEEPE